MNWLTVHSITVHHRRVRSSTLRGEIEADMSESYDQMRMSNAKTSPVGSAQADQRALDEGSVKQ